MGLTEDIAKARAKREEVMANTRVKTDVSHVRVLLRDYEGTHVEWIDPDGGAHTHTWSNPHESIGFILRHVDRWRKEWATGTTDAEPSRGVRSSIASNALARRLAPCVSPSDIHVDVFPHRHTRVTLIGVDRDSVETMRAEAWKAIRATMNNRAVRVVTVDLFDRDGAWLSRERVSPGSA